jgi:ABC-type branched-subunit amino acid transport system substrate-binding protein
MAKSLEQKALIEDYAVKPKNLAISTSAAISPALEKKIITIGQTAALAGSMLPFQQAINNGIAAFIKKTNAKGGICGHKLSLTILNNKNNPAKAAQDIEELEKKDICLIVGPAGSRNINAILPMVKNKKIALFFPWGMSLEADKKSLPYLIHGQNIMRMHLKKLSSHLAENLHHTRIGIIHSDSSFSTLNALYVENLLKSYRRDENIMVISKHAYNNKLFNADEVALSINTSRPHALLFLSTSKPTAKIIQKIWKSGNHPTDIVGSEGNFFAAQQFDGGDINFHYSSAVPNIDEIEYPIVSEYLEASRAYLPDQVPNTLSLTYYINMKLLAIAFERIIKDKKIICKETVLAELDSIKNQNIGGFIGDFNRKTHALYPLNVSILKG